MDINDVPRITCEELKELIDRGDNPVVIDTRKSSEYKTGHIKGAINIYYDPSGYSMDREITLSALPPDMLLVFYCDCMDDSTSALMALEMRDMRYDIEKVKALEGGWPRWLELGYPTEPA